MMRGNNLGELRNVKPYMNEITHFDMSSSEITKIKDNVMNSIINNSLYIDITNNKLKYLPTSIGQSNNRTKIWISNNPYECNCDMMWTRDWLVQATNVMDKENVKCGNGDMIGNKTTHSLFLVITCVNWVMNPWSFC